MILAVVGSRSFTDYQLLKEEIDKIRKDHKIEGLVSGGAKGADSLAEEYARKNGLEITVFYPDWKKYGRRAGYIRNEKIVNACDRLIAFWDGQSRGTNHSINMARDQGTEYDIIFYNSPFYKKVKEEKNNESSGNE